MDKLVSAGDKLAETDGGFVRIRGAREHNLKDVSLDIPEMRWLCSPVYPDQGSPRWPSGRSTRKHSAAIWNPSRRTRGGSSTKWPYRNWIGRGAAPGGGAAAAARIADHQILCRQRHDVVDLRGCSIRAPAIIPANSPCCMRNRSRRIRQKAPVQIATASVGSMRSASGSCARRQPDIRERAVAAWPTAWQGQNLRDILVSLGYDVDRPWRELPKKDRDWILFTDQPTVPVHAGYTRPRRGGR